MGTLVQVADGLTPQADYSFLPASVRWWFGYVGKPEIGAWTREQVAALEATGRIWGAIWTAGDGPAYTRADALADAHSMIAGLRVLSYPMIRPVLLDIEASRWQANPATTEDAARYWCQIMSASGYINPEWYCVCQSSAGWRACWTGQPPTSLPAGVVGIQYDHALAGDRYDISVFDPAFLTGGNVSAPTAPENAAAVWAALTDTGLANATPGVAGHRLANIDERVAGLSTQIHNQALDTQAAITALAGQVTELTALVKAAPTLSGHLTGTMDVTLTEAAG